MKDSNIAASENYGDCSVHSCMIIWIIYYYWVIFFRSFVYSFIRLFALKYTHWNPKENETDEENSTTENWRNHVDKNVTADEASANTECVRVHVRAREKDKSDE